MSISRRSWLIVSILGVLALAAVAVTVPAAHTAWHRPGHDPAAPGLAALGDDQLLRLLPAPGDFPPGWIVSSDKGIVEDFGYYTSAPRKSPFNFTPQECDGLATVLSTGAFHAAEVSGYAPAGPQRRAERHGIRLIVGREFDPAGFTDMIALVSRCPNSIWQIRPGDEIRYTVQILENSHPDGGPQRFRYSLTTASDGRSGEPKTAFFSYARAAGLVLSGSGGAGHQQEFDGLFDNVLTRLRAG